MKAVIFDLDGVLADTREMHYVALNEALMSVAGPSFVISQPDHLTQFNGLSTRSKLQLLTKDRGLNVDLHNAIWEKKQERTCAAIRTVLRPDLRLRTLLNDLRNYKLVLVCASNCIGRTLHAILAALDLSDCFDFIFSSDNVRQPKPKPEIYFLALATLQLPADEVLIVEDSPHGLAAARCTNAVVLEVSGPHEVTRHRLYPLLHMPMRTNVVVPMAGAGSRFHNVYDLPKPLILVHSKPMIQIVIDNLCEIPNPHFIFIIQKAHEQLYHVEKQVVVMLPKAATYSVVQVDGLTDGAARTVLRAQHLWEPEEPLFIANSDQWVEWSAPLFFENMMSCHADGGIVTFTASDPKWSYCQIDDQQRVTEVAEKRVISSHATVGFYWWRCSADFVRATNCMIEKEIRTNNEFYVCPIFNEAILEGLKIIAFDCQQMWSLGTPEDLWCFLLKDKCIAHRGNVNGPAPATENDPGEILRVHALYKCDVETDVWWVDNTWYLGHEAPTYVVDGSFLQQPFVWCHAKNVAALVKMRTEHIRCFWHQEDAYTLVSNGDIWCYPGQTLQPNCIAVLPEQTKTYTFQDLLVCKAICSDFQNPQRWIRN